MISAACASACSPVVHNHRSSRRGSTGGRPQCRCQNRRWPVRRNPDLDIVRLRDVRLAPAADPIVLQWAAGEGRVLLTHHHATLVGFAYDRVARGEPMSGVIAVDERHQIGPAIDDVLLLLECTLDDEWGGRVFFVPV